MWEASHNHTMEYNKEINIEKLEMTADIALEIEAIFLKQREKKRFTLEQEGSNKTEKNC
jgi:hypothetical protein